jgi:AcrR family transcriptional regulator
MLSTESPSKVKILQAAVKLFYEHGIKATGVDLIIEESGVSKTTFFKYYPSKKDLVAAYLSQWYGNFITWFTSKLQTISGTPEEQILGIFDILTTWFGDPSFKGCAFLNTIGEVRDPRSMEFQLSVQHKSDLRDKVHAIVDNGNFINKDALTDGLLLLIDGAIVRAQLLQCPEPGIQAKRMAGLLLAAHR